MRLNTSCTMLVEAAQKTLLETEMARILIEGRGTVAFVNARLFFTPGKSHYPSGYLQPRAGHIRIRSMGAISSLVVKKLVKQRPFH